MFTDMPADKAWGEWECYSYDSGCPCQYRQQPILILRGLCKNSGLTSPDDTLGTQYTPKQLAGSPKDVFLVGGFSTQIHYNDSSEQWVITDAASRVRAESRASRASYALGKHEWTITNDVFSCSKGVSYSTHLKLSGCNPLGEFTCSDGQCVTMKQRCDQLPDCRDESDEMGCQLVVVKDGYNRNIPPISSVSATDRTVVPVPVHISINLLKIVSMEEVQHKIDFKFLIILEWKENRVSYFNLKEKTSLNALTQEDVTKLWLPYVVYANTDMQEAVQLEDGLDTAIVVTRKGNFTRSSIEVTDETEIFEGKDNPLAMYQTYTKSFQCLYNLKKYPFDTQVIFVLNTNHSLSCTYSRYVP